MLAAERKWESKEVGRKVPSRALISRRFWCAKPTSWLSRNAKSPQVSLGTAQRRESLKPTKSPQEPTEEWLQGAVFPQMPRRQDINPQ